MRRAEILLLAAVLVVAAGCTTPGVQGPPERGFGPRPVDVPVERIADPCTLFSPVQQADLGLRKPSSTTPTVNGQPSLACGWLSATDIGYNAQTIPIGAEVALTDPAATIVQIDGFGAAQNVVREFTGGAPTCQVTVDAAPGRSIRVQAQSQKVHPRVRSDEEMCRLAADAASMVMTTVVATTR